MIASLAFELRTMPSVIRAMPLRDWNALMEHLNEQAREREKAAVKAKARKGRRW